MKTIIMIKASVSNIIIIIIIILIKAIGPMLPAGARTPKIPPHIMPGNILFAIIIIVIVIIIVVMLGNMDDNDDVGISL